MSNRKFADKWDGSDPRSAYQAFLNDVEFYRERSTELTVALLQERDAIEPYLTKDVVSAFNTYMRACICFFRSKDMNDINQKEYLEEGEGDFSTFAIKTEQELEAEAWQELEDMCGDDLGEVPYQLADTIMMRQITLKSQPNTLDRFLKYEKTEAPIILPQQKEIDLEHPDLKKKPFFPPPPPPPPQPISLSPTPTPPPPANTPYPTTSTNPSTKDPTPTPTPTPEEKSINDVRETATEIIEDILSCLLEKLETEMKPGEMSEEPAAPTEPTEKKNKHKNKHKKKKQTSKLGGGGGGEALHVDI